MPTRPQKLFDYEIIGGNNQLGERLGLHRNLVRWTTRTGQGDGNITTDTL